MRILIRLLLALMILGIAAGILFYYLNSNREESKRSLARAEVIRLQQQVYLQAALTSSEEEQRIPEMIDPAWFPEILPTNPLFEADRPWLEVAGAEQLTRQHPPNLTADDRSIASFWYNPATGIVRARVPVGISDAQALALYNEVNDSGLTSLFPTD